MFSSISADFSDINRFKPENKRYTSSFTKTKPSYYLCSFNIDLITKLLKIINPYWRPIHIELEFNGIHLLFMRIHLNFLQSNDDQFNENYINPKTEYLQYHFVYQYPVYLKNYHTNSDFLNKLSLNDKLYKVFLKRKMISSQK